MTLQLACPVGCGNPTPPGHHLCTRCWATVSERARRALTIAYRSWVRGGSEAAYVNALAYAVRSSKHGRRHLARRHPTLALRHRVQRKQKG